MFKAVVQEAAALASLAMFVGMIAIWSQVLGNSVSRARVVSALCRVSASSCAGCFESRHDAAE